MEKRDVIVIGAGLVGLASAFELLKRRPGLKLTVLEKEHAPALHQSGHNSGVLHTGVYYKPGSLKAENCKRGKALLEEFARKHSVPFELCGKLIVAGDSEEIPRLNALAERASAHGLPHRLISIEEAKEIEPHLAGVSALHIPSAGIIDYPRVAEALTKEILARGGEVRFNASFRNATRSNGRIVINAGSSFESESSVVVNCAGLHSDRVAKALGSTLPIQIVPFRGEYYELSNERSSLCRALIYPVPDLRFPFLGVHLTKMIRGGDECGPNAVLALARQGYSWRDINLKETFGTLTYSGFLRFAKKHWKAGSAEIYRSISKEAFLRSIQRLVPEVRLEDLKPGGSGVRAQALNPSGDLVDDFVFDIQKGVVNVLNAPSPAATACLSIGEKIGEAVLNQL